MSFENRTNALGYHVNDTNRCKKFVDNSDYLIFSEDTFWLGYGMYFWDNVSNAKYWMEQKKRKEKFNTYICTKANIYTDEEHFLDLTDGDTISLIEELWKKYCQRKGENEKQPLGIKIDKLIKFFDELKDTKVIRGIGDYNINQKENDPFRFNTAYCGPQIRCCLKVIYCVRHSEVVFNRKIFSEV